MTTNDKKIPEFKPVKKLSPFVADPHNSRGGGRGKKGAAVNSAASSGRKMAVASNLKKGGSGDR